MVDSSELGNQQFLRGNTLTNSMVELSKINRWIGSECIFGNHWVDYLLL